MANEPQQKGALEMAKQARYEVVALTGGVTGDVRARCGHKHKTSETAERCRERLSASWEETQGVHVSSLLWYNARVREIGV